MRIAHQGFVLDDAIERFDFDTVRAWLSGSYWSPGITLREVAFGFRNSTLVIGTYRDGAQVGCLRLASDRTRFAYVMDVFVDPAWRGRGIARRMVRGAMEHPDTKLVYQWMLATHDAHGVYAPLGFAPLPHPERVMGFRRERDWLPEAQNGVNNSVEAAP
jgi:GNAT superfamily N-acetyltransferase